MDSDSRKNFELTPMVEDATMFLKSAPLNGLLHQSFLNNPSSIKVITGSAGSAKSTAVLQWLGTFQASSEQPYIYYQECTEQTRPVDVMRSIIQFAQLRSNSSLSIGGSRGGGNLSTELELFESFRLHIAGCCSERNQFIIVLENIQFLLENGILDFIRIHNTLETRPGRSKPRLLLTAETTWYQQWAIANPISSVLEVINASVELTRGDQDQFLSNVLQFYFKRMTPQHNKLLTQSMVMRNPLMYRLVCVELLEAKSSQELSTMLQ
jgi:Cdc6-like AAA superfamily ATPase